MSPHHGSGQLVGIARLIADLTATALAVVTVPSPAAANRGAGAAAPACWSPLPLQLTGLPMLPPSNRRSTPNVTR